jgi:hypothetical protein
LPQLLVTCSLWSLLLPPHVSRGVMTHMYTVLQSTVQYTVLHRKLRPQQLSLMFVTTARFSGLVHAIRQCPLMTNRKLTSITLVPYRRLTDLDTLATTYGMESFLLVPLACAGNDLGALLLASSPPAYLDKYGTMLATDLGLALSQTLYTLACIGQMRAGQQILHDIMPEKVSNRKPSPDPGAFETYAGCSVVRPCVVSKQRTASYPYLCSQVRQHAATELRQSSHTLLLLPTRWRSSCVGVSLGRARAPWRAPGPALALQLTEGPCRGLPTSLSSRLCPLLCHQTASTTSHC